MLSSGFLWWMFYAVTFGRADSSQQAPARLCWNWWRSPKSLGPACLRWGAECGPFLPLMTARFVFRLADLDSIYRFYRLVISCCVQTCCAWPVTCSASNWGFLSQIWTSGRQEDEWTYHQELKLKRGDAKLATFVWSALPWCVLSLTSFALGVVLLGEPWWTSVGGLRTPIFVEQCLRTQNQSEPVLDSRRPDQTVHGINAWLYDSCDYDSFQVIESLGLLGSQSVWPVWRLGAGLRSLLQP